MCRAMVERRGFGARTFDVLGYPESVGARTEDVHGYPEVGLQIRALVENSNRSGQICLPEVMGWKTFVGSPTWSSLPILNCF